MEDRLIPPRYDSLDVWRGIACLMIVVFHSTSEYRRFHEPSGTNGWTLQLLESLWIGVPLFYVISGFCIAASVDSLRRRDGYLKAYAEHRVRRIYPPYLICLLGHALLLRQLESWLSGQSARYTGAAWVAISDLNWLNWLGNLFLLENWLPGSFGEPKKLIVPVAWTLCYEQQFYLVCFVLLGLFPRRFFWAVGGVSVCSVIVLLLMGPGPCKRTFAGYWWDGSWIEFALGVGLYRVLIYSTYVRTGVAYGVLAAALGYLIWEFSSNPGCLQPRGRAVQFELAVSVVFTLLLLIMHKHDARVRRLSWLRPLGFCGLICYSLYLVHWPICRAGGWWFWHRGYCHLQETLLLTVPGCVAVSVLVGWVFHIVVERQFMNVSAPQRHKLKTKVAHS